MLLFSIYPELSKEEIARSGVTMPGSSVALIEPVSIFRPSLTFFMRYPLSSSADEKESRSKTQKAYLRRFKVSFPPVRGRRPQVSQSRLQTPHIRSAEEGRMRRRYVSCQFTFGTRSRNFHSASLFFFPPPLRKRKRDGS